MNDGRDESEARELLRVAERDLRAAERLQSGRRFALRWACYLAQQAAEKALKAVLLGEEIPFPATHRLDYLHDLVPAGRRSAAVDVDLEPLSTWVTVPEFPEVPGEPEEPDVETAVATARAVVDAAHADVV